MTTLYKCVADFAGDAHVVDVNERRTEHSIESAYQFTD